MCLMIRNKTLIGLSGGRISSLPVCCGRDALSGDGSGLEPKVMDTFSIDPLT